MDLTRFLALAGLLNEDAHVEKIPFDVANAHMLSKLRMVVDATSKEFWECKAQVKTSLFGNRGQIVLAGPGRQVADLKGRILAAAHAIPGVGETPVEEEIEVTSGARDAVNYSCTTKDEFRTLMKALEDAQARHPNVRVQMNTHGMSAGFTGQIVLTGQQAEIASFQNEMLALNHPALARAA